jgi:hypothetical protein
MFESLALCFAFRCSASLNMTPGPTQSENAFYHTMSPMNAFWNSLETLLGLGVEPKDLMLVQNSLRERPTTFAIFDSRAWNGAATSALSKNKFDPDGS